MSGLVRLKRLDLWTRRRGFGKANLVSFKVNPRLRLGLTLNPTRLALLGGALMRQRLRWRVPLEARKPPKIDANP